MIPDRAIDASGLRAIVAEALKYSSRAPAKVVNSTIFHIARLARKYTPHVSTAQIDAELAVKVVPVIGKRGVPLKRKRDYSSERTVTVARGNRTSSVPLVALIIQKQVGGRRHASPFRGVTRSQGAQLMRDAISRMIKARRSSTHFLVAGWIAVLKEARRYLYGNAPVDVTTIRTDDAFGDFTPAASGTRVSASIANRIGMAGPNAAKFNAALHRHSGPALQRAVNEQALSMARHYAKKILTDTCKQKFAARGGKLS